MNYTRKSQIDPQNVTDIANERVYATHLGMLSKIDLKVQMDAKSGQLSNESRSKVFGAPNNARESAIKTTINAFDVRLMVQFRVHLIIHLEIHL